MNEQLSKVLRKAEDTVLNFWCPACEIAHGVPVGKGFGPRWEWNGDVDRPTFSPSIRVRGVQRITDEIRDRLMRGEQVDPVPFTCHSFVTDGVIRFLDDCTHALAGHAAPLGEWPEYH